MDASFSLDFILYERLEEYTLPGSLEGQNEMILELYYERDLGRGGLTHLMPRTGTATMFSVIKM